MSERVDLEASRRAKLDAIRAMKIDPYTLPGSMLVSLADVRSLHATSFGKDGGPDYCVVGRIQLRRGMGKLSFLTIEEEGTTIQIALDHSRLGETDRELVKLLDLGDIIWVNGNLGATKSGEITLWANHLWVCAKALVPPPDKVEGLTDHETRYRNRHIDLMANHNVRDVVKARSKIVNAIRGYLIEGEYIEVETPMMQASAGGAAAKPFTTHHNALDVGLHLRIAPELYLKRLLVGGLPRVFEIGKNFRNEGLSPRHNPEFTVVEAYRAFANYNDMLELVQRMITFVCKEAFGKEVFQYGEHTIDFGKTWKVVRLAELVPGDMTPEERYKIYEERVEPTLIQPTFVTHMPASLVPLAKESLEYPGYAEMFELVIGGQEIAPGYTEQNDPLAQLEAFRKQSGSDQHVADIEFIDVLKSGMPPSGGMGLGIDRLTAILLNQPSIRDVILFPLLRPKV